MTYSYTFSLLIEFLKEQEFINPQRVTLADITKERIINFLQWLEEDRHCSVSTRNARLAAIRSFYSYLQYRDVKGMFRYHEIMSIRKKKTAAPEMAYLTIDGIKLILSQPDLKTRYGRRDFVLLSLLYDSGARVQELEGLVPYAPNAVISISYIHPFSLCNEYVTNLLILSLTALSPWMHGWFCECKYNKFQIRPQVRGFVLSIVNTTVKRMFGFKPN